MKGMTPALIPVIFQPEVLGVLIGFGLLVVVPLTSMFLGHQRRMAELIHGKQNEALEQSVRELQQRVQQLETALIMGRRPEALEQAMAERELQLP